MKPIRLSLVAAVFPLALNAQQATSANPITDTFRGFAYYGTWLMMAFDSIPESKYGFKPTPAQQSIGYIAQHLEDASYALCQRFSGLARPMTARDSLADTIRAKFITDLTDHYSRIANYMRLLGLTPPSALPRTVVRR